MPEGFNWTCPHCQRHVTITNTISGNQTTLYNDNSIGRVTLTSTFIVCPNPDCQKFTLTATLNKSEGIRDIHGRNKELIGDQLEHWSLIPPSTAKVFPDYIPEQILADYKEACLIKELSPKASATLSRRCIQGIIRNFWEVKPARLVDEIESIKDKVDPLTWDAIDTIRKVGNIGAHMEKDIDLIIDVDPNEAELLINLIETLLNDWYISREERKNRLNSIVEMGVKKQVERKGEKSS